MREIDLKTWNRRDHYKLFSALQFPHFSINTEVRVTALVRYAKRRGLSLHNMLLYLVCRSANEIPAFRLRIRGRKVVEHKTIAIAPTTAWKNGLYTFAVMAYDKNPAVFMRTCDAAKARSMAMDRLNLDDDAKTGDASVYASCVPWIHLAAATNPLASSKDCIPRVLWGKCVPRGRDLVIGFSVQCHHALVDGRDVALFIEKLEELAASAPKLFAGC